MRAEQLTISELARWYYGAHELWPAIYPLERLGRYWSYAEVLLSDGEAETESEKQRMRASYLRGSLLKMLRNAAADCTRCPLSTNRLPNRPVLDDGAISSDPFYQFDEELALVAPLSAEIMVVGEGPGQFEQRTGVPFVSFSVLAGSFCATECKKYEGCYVEGFPYPRQPCDFEPLIDDRLGLQQSRADGRLKINTAGRLLDCALLEAGFWREGWNARFRLRPNNSEKTQPRPGSVYLTNVVKCRSTDANGNDTSPSVKEADACRTYFEQQLHIVQPKVIVALGATAVKFLTDMRDPKILSIRGEVMLGLDQLPVVVEVHPSWILRQTDPAAQQEATLRLTESLGLAQEIAAGSYRLPWIEEQVAHVIQTAPSTDPFADPEDAEFIPTFPTETPA